MVRNHSSSHVQRASATKLTISCLIPFLAGIERAAIDSARRRRLGYPTFALTDTLRRLLGRSFTASPRYRSSDGGRIGRGDGKDG